MPITTDLLNTTLADLKGPLEHTFEAKSPLHDLLQKRGKVSTERGQIIERTIMGGSVAQGKGIVLGTETIPGGRTEQTKKIQLQTGRAVVRIDIPKRELRENEGKTGVMKLITAYPESVMKLLPQDFDRFFFSGVSHGYVLPTAEMQSWNTLNGQKTFATGIIGVTNGLIDVDNAPSAQTATVQNLAKSSTYNYVNQRGEISSYALDGKRTYRRVAREVGQYNPTSADAKPDIAFIDFDSYALIEEDNESHVRIMDMRTDFEKGGSNTELMVSGIRYVASKNLIRSDFTGDAADGICYMLTLDGLEVVWFQKPELSDFDDRIPNQDVVTAKMEMQFALLMRGMRMQGCVVGGARA